MQKHLIRRSITILGLFGVVAVAVGYALRPEVIEVDASRLVRGPMRVTIDEDGITRVRDRFVVTAPTAGRLERIALREGTPIAAGEVVALIAPLPLDVTTSRQAEARWRGAEALTAEAQSLVEQARAALNQSQRSLSRSETLLASGAVSPESHERALLDVRSRQSELDAAVSRVRATRSDEAAARAALLAIGGGASGKVAVRSPTSGRVLRVPEASERVINAGAPILELGDARVLEVIADVLSSDATRMRVGDSVEIAEWGGDSSLRARIRTIEPAAFTRVSALGVDEQRVNVRMDLVDPPPGLGDGFRVETRTIVWRAPSVLKAPPSAVFQDGQRWALYLVEDGRARLRNVDIGHRSGNAIEILSGVREGARVILFPSDRIKNGVRVKSTAE
jgi:HlyD family secretion protein